mmetsp:Transcript_6619/g.16431  ORF Transcript_6619/g.16431 Transcript_6619/m.16431 type:complete len:278 (+) Transcript_6619:9473-10306(+)
MLRGISTIVAEVSSDLHRGRKGETRPACSAAASPVRVRDDDQAIIVQRGDDPRAGAKQNVISKRRASGRKHHFCVYQPQGPTGCDDDQRLNPGNNHPPISSLGRHTAGSRGACQDDGMTSRSAIHHDLVGASRRVHQQPSPGIHSYVVAESKSRTVDADVHVALEPALQLGSGSHLLVSLEQKAIHGEHKRRFAEYLRRLEPHAELCAARGGGSCSPRRPLQLQLQERGDVEESPGAVSAEPPKHFAIACIPTLSTPILRGSFAHSVLARANDPPQG